VYCSSEQPGNAAFAWARLQAIPATPMSMSISGLKIELLQSDAAHRVVLKPRLDVDDRLEDRRVGLLVRGGELEDGTLVAVDRVAVEQRWEGR
jgi:hypothetical protein